MEMICPQCRGPLTSPDGQTAHCPAHGTAFRILFQRQPKTASPSTLPAAEGASETESAPFAVPPNSSDALTATPDGAESPPASSPPLAPSRFAAFQCVRHPAVSASAQCCSCGAYVCATCDFPLPNGTHVCPDCAVASQTRLSPGRKRGLWWSLGLAVWCTLGIVAIFAGAFAGSVDTQVEQNLLGLLFTFFVLIPGVVGFSLGMGVLNRRLVNPPLLWVATVWNALIVVLFIVLSIIGSG